MLTSSTNVLNVKQDDAGYTIPYHPSIPEGSVQGWRSFPPPHKADSILTHGGVPASQRRQSTAASANPIVSRYYTGEQELRPKVPEPGPVPPSRSWSPIPSVHRRSFSRVGQEGSTKHLTLSSEPQAQSTPFRQSINSEHSATSGDRSNEHKRRLIEYPVIPVERQEVASVCTVTTWPL